jgi:hypothetical protein
MMTIVSLVAMANPSPPRRRFAARFAGVMPQEPSCPGAFLPALRPLDGP